MGNETKTVARRGRKIPRLTETRKRKTIQYNWDISPEQYKLKFYINLFGGFTSK
jgi:hypothetical protein